MEIGKEIVDEIVILRPKGNILSGVDANMIHQMVHEELEMNRINFVLDMTDVSLINSSGIGILIGALTAAKNQNGEIKLASVTDKVAHILSMMRLDQVFKMYKSVPEAEQSFISLNQRETQAENYVSSGDCRRTVG